MPTPEPTIPICSDDPAESQRFIDMAREIGADESPQAMDRAFGKIIGGPLIVRQKSDSASSQPPGRP